MGIEYKKETGLPAVSLRVNKVVLLLPRKVRRLSKAEINTNKKRQLILKRAGYNVPTNGSWGTWQQGLWDKYSKEHPDVVRAYFDLAPRVSFVPSGQGYAGLFEDHQGTLANVILKNYDDRNTEEAKNFNRNLNNEYYKQVNDSIESRKKEGFYKLIPSLRLRDIQMRDQYKDNTNVGAWSCINSVTGLSTPIIVYSNKDFANEQHSKLGYRKLNPGLTLNPGDLIQTPKNKHAVLYLGDDTYYNTHGFVVPFKNGNQIEEHDYYSIGNTYRKQ